MQMFVRRSVCLSDESLSRVLKLHVSGFRALSGLSQDSLRTLSGVSQVSLRCLSGVSQVSLRSLLGLSQGLRSFLGLSYVL